MAFESKIQAKAEGSFVALKGTINEDSEVKLEELKDLVPGQQPVEFNFKEVLSINSCGVRAWIHFLRDIEKKCPTISFSDCTPDIVNQMNMIPSFKGKATVLSIYTLFECPSCSNHEKILMKQGENLPTEIPQSELHLPCSNCGKEMEMEELAQEYFAWIKNS